MLTNSGRTYVFDVRFGYAWNVVVLLPSGANKKAAGVHSFGQEESVSFSGAAVENIAKEVIRMGKRLFGGHWNSFSLMHPHLCSRTPC